MIPLSPSAVASPHAGLSFSRSAGHLFRPIYVDEAGSVLLWDSEFSGLFGKAPVLRDFLTDVVFEGGGDDVVFSRFEGGKDVLTATLGLDQGAKLPRRLFLQLRKAEADFKGLGATGVLTEQQSAFVQAFNLPDPLAFPAAYRVRKAGIFSRKKLYVLWGMVPENPRAQPTIRMGGVFVPDADRSGSSTGSSVGDEMGFGVPLDGPSAEEVIAYDEDSEWPRWIQLLIWLLGIAILLFLLGFFLSLMLEGCQGDSSNVLNKASAVVPPVEQRISQLNKKKEQLADKSDSQIERERVIAIDNALRHQGQAQEAERAYAEAQRKAETARKKAENSYEPADKKYADDLSKDAQALKRENDVAQAEAEDSFRSPQETLRKDQLQQNERFNELSRQAEEAKKIADVSGLAEDRTKADNLQQEAESAKRSIPGLPLSPSAEKEARTKLYVMPKSSRESGEVVVRRFKEDELVPKKGIKLHLEADGNGRKDFKVKGWAFGVSSMIEEERLEGFVPVGPGLSIDTPLDLYFEYRGDDGQMHEDCAPFVITGDIEFRLSLEIEHAKEDPTPPPAAKPNPGA